MAWKFKQQKANYNKQKPSATAASALKITQKKYIQKNPQLLLHRR
jgi:hypothetical protein